MPTEDMILEAESDLTQQRLKQQDGPMLVLHPVLTTKVVKNSEEWRRNSIFHTRIRCNVQLYSLVIDGRSCTNIMPEKVCKKLSLKTKPHPELYKVAWVDNTNLKIQKICMVTYKIGEFTEHVLYDVLPLKVCHILLGRP